MDKAASVYSSLVCGLFNNTENMLENHKIALKAVERNFGVDGAMDACRQFAQARPFSDIGYKVVEVLESAASFHDMSRVQRSMSGGGCYF